MEEADIDIWYEEQKQMLSEQYMKSIAKGMGVEQRAKHFDKAMARLNLEYDARHAKYRRMLLNKSSRSTFFSALARPFKAIGSGFRITLIFIGSGISGLFKENYAQVHFTANIAHIRHTYKFTDGIHSFFRPSYYFYARHLKLPLIVLTKPFVNYFKAAKQGFIQMKDGLSNAGAFLWKCTKTAAKFIVTHALSAHKKIAVKLADFSKRYHEAQAKRVQANLDRQQKKKEEKENKLKEKGQKVQAETKNIDQTDAASTV